MHRSSSEAKETGRAAICYIPSFHADASPFHGRTLGVPSMVVLVVEPEPDAAFAVAAPVVVADFDRGSDRDLDDGASIGIVRSHWTVAVSPPSTFQIPLRSESDRGDSSAARSFPLLHGHPAVALFVPLQFGAYSPSSWHQSGLLSMPKTVPKRTKRRWSRYRWWTSSEAVPWNMG